MTGPGYGARGARTESREGSAGLGVPLLLRGGRRRLAGRQPVARGAAVFFAARLLGRGLRGASSSPATSWRPSRRRRESGWPSWPGSSSRASSWRGPSSPPSSWRLGAVLRGHRVTPAPSWRGRGDGLRRTRAGRGHRPQVRGGRGASRRRARRCATEPCRLATARPLADGAHGTGQRTAGAVIAVRPTWPATILPMAAVPFAAVDDLGDRVLPARHCVLSSRCFAFAASQAHRRRTQSRSPRSPVVTCTVTGSNQFATPVGLPANGHSGLIP